MYYTGYLNTGFYIPYHVRTLPPCNSSAIFLSPSAFIS